MDDTHLFLVVHILQTELVLVVQHQLVDGILESLHLLRVNVHVRPCDKDLFHVFHCVSFSSLSALRSQYVTLFSLRCLCALSSFQCCATVDIRRRASIPTRRFPRSHPRSPAGVAMSTVSISGFLQQSTSSFDSGCRRNPRVMFPCLCVVVSRSKRRKIAVAPALTLGDVMVHCTLLLSRNERALARPKVTSITGVGGKGMSFFHHRWLYVKEVQHTPMSPSINPLSFFSSRPFTRLLFGGLRIIRNAVHGQHAVLSSNKQQGAIVIQSHTRHRQR